MEKIIKKHDTPFAIQGILSNQFIVYIFSLYVLFTGGFSIYFILQLIVTLEFQGKIRTKTPNYKNCLWKIKCKQSTDFNLEGTPCCNQHHFKAPTDSRSTNLFGKSTYIVFMNCHISWDKKKSEYHTYIVFYFSEIAWVFYLTSFFLDWLNFEF